MYELDEDRQVVAVAPGIYRGRITERWDVGSVPNGGYVLCVGMAALEQVFPGADPLTATAHYLRPAIHGPVDVHVEVVKRGRRHSTAVARMEQDGKEHVRLIATYGALDRPGSPVHIDGEPPDVPLYDVPPLEGGRGAPIPEVSKRFEIHFAEDTVGWARGERSKKAEVRGRIRLRDGRPPDVHSLALFADAFFPPVFNVTKPGWVPTLELTVHFRARPRPGWLRCVFRTRFLFGGYFEEDGEIWDESGALVALSRQLAAAPA